MNCPPSKSVFCCHVTREVVRPLFLPKWWVTGFMRILLARHSPLRSVTIPQGWTRRETEEYESGGPGLEFAGSDTVRLVVMRLHVPLLPTAAPRVKSVTSEILGVNFRRRPGKCHRSCGLQDRRLPCVCRVCENIGKVPNQFVCVTWKLLYG